MIIQKRDFQKKELDPIAYNVQKLFRQAANNITENDDRRNLLYIITSTIAMINRLLKPLLDEQQIN